MPLPKAGEVIAVADAIREWSRDALSSNEGMFGAVFREACLYLDNAAEALLVRELTEERAS